MKIKHLLEGAEQKLPGAFSGVQVMTPQQFVAKSAEGEEPKPEEGVAEGSLTEFAPGDGDDSGNNQVSLETVAKIIAMAFGNNVIVTTGKNKDQPSFTISPKNQIGKKIKVWSTLNPRTKQVNPTYNTILFIDGTGKHVEKAKPSTYANALSTANLLKKQQGVAEGAIKDVESALAKHGQYKVDYENKYGPMKGSDLYQHEVIRKQLLDRKRRAQNAYAKKQGVAEGSPSGMIRFTLDSDRAYQAVMARFRDHIDRDENHYYLVPKKLWSQVEQVADDAGGYAENVDDPDGNENPEHYGVAEANGDLLGAQTRPLGGQELQDYMGRIAGREKGKTDKYKLPYIHRSSVVKYYSEEGKRYDENQIVQALKQRPKKLLKQNEKMKHSNGELEQFFNIGFAALVGVAVNESTDSLVIVNTCPGAGSCKVDCFAMKGGKVQFEGPWLSDGRILTYLLNDPTGFFNQLSSEITKEEKAGLKGGYKVTIRWHDAGDFFSPEYVDMAFKLANAHPNVQFYAYTKMGDVAVGEKPNNFIINWSEGANTAQEKKVKAQDPNLERTKNSRIVPSDLFYDLLVKDEKKNLVKGPSGQWQVIPNKLPELKQRLAKQYGISANSILSYDEWDQKTQGGQKETPVKYNVIITPGEPDITAKSHGVLSTLLLKH